MHVPCSCRPFSDCSHVHDTEFSSDKKHIQLFFLFFQMNLLDSLDCEICRESYDTEIHEAQQLPCFHTFCKSCVGKLQSPIVCPTCRAVTRRNAIKRNFALMAVVDELKVNKMHDVKLKTLSKSMESQSENRKRMHNLTTFDLKTGIHPLVPIDALVTIRKTLPSTTTVTAKYRIVSSVPGAMTLQDLNDKKTHITVSFRPFKKQADEADGTGIGAWVPRGMTCKQAKENKLRVYFEHLGS